MLHPICFSCTSRKALFTFGTSPQMSLFNLWSLHFVNVNVYIWFDMNTLLCAHFSDIILCGGNPDYFCVSCSSLSWQSSNVTTLWSVFSVCVCVLRYLFLWLSFSGTPIWMSHKAHARTRDIINHILSKSNKAHGCGTSTIDAEEKLVWVVLQTHSCFCTSAYITIVEHMCEVIHISCYMCMSHNNDHSSPL